jgi:hypothetical protein
MNKKKIKNLRKNISKNLFRTEINIALGGISHLEARLHRLTVSGNYKYSQCKKNLGGMYFDTNFNPKKKYERYQRKDIKQLKNFQLNVFTFPKEGGYPLCLIVILPKKDLPIKTYKEFLMEFDSELMPDMMISSIEYAIDLFCNNYENARNLFWLLRRCTYIPYQRKVITLKTAQIERYGKTIERNEVYRIGKTHKIYERGPDLKKDEKGWDLENINRVRLEYTAKRTPIKKKGIDSLSDLIKDSHFIDLNKDRWKFRQFEGSNKLPKIWQPYLVEDENGFAGAFQSEHIQAKNMLGKNNIGQYTKVIEEMLPLGEQMNEAMSAFDKSWLSVHV